MSISTFASVFSSNQLTGPAELFDRRQARSTEVSRRSRRTAARRTGRPPAPAPARAADSRRCRAYRLPGHVAEDAVVRPGHSTQQVQHGQSRPPPAHRTAHPGAATARGGRQRQQQLAAAERGEAPELRQIDQPQAPRRSPVSPSAAVGKAASSGRRASTSVRTTAASTTSEYTWLFGCPAASPMAVRLPLLLTGKPCSSPAASVARAESEQLLLRVDALPMPGGEGAPGQHVVCVADDRQHRTRG